MHLKSHGLSKKYNFLTDFWHFGNKKIDIRGVQVQIEFFFISSDRRIQTRASFELKIEFGDGKMYSSGNIVVVANVWTFLKVLNYFCLMSFRRLSKMNAKNTRYFFNNNKKLTKTEIYLRK